MKTKSVRFGPVEYNIVYKEPDLEDSHYKKLQGELGACYHAHGLMYLTEGQSRDQEIVSAVHESFHCMLEPFPILSKKKEEDVVTALGFATVSWMRDNPDLVAEIMEG